MLIFKLKGYYPLFLMFLFFSCAPKKEMIYLYNTDGNAANQTESLNYEPKFQNDDILSITVSAENPEVAAPYNLQSVSVSNGNGLMNNQMTSLENYIIDKNGEIEFPQIGKIKMAGLTRIEAIDKLKNILSEYITNPTVHIRLVNFKISVLGEVNSPGAHVIRSERVTLLEALSLSGDLTIFGKRKNIMIIRENEGVKAVAKVDITDANFLNSDYYYLKQNDVIYVEPNGARRNAAVIGPNISVGLSVLSFAIGVILLITR